MHTLLSQALAARGYETLTDVQQAVTDPELVSSDLLVSAQTGSGKTVGFGLAIAPTLLPDDGPLPPAGLPIALVVAPTRELALQVMQELRWLYDLTGARVVSCVGGMDMQTERRALERGAHIVVGTPGRLRDHITRGSLDLSGLRAIVLDEADEMLDLGFREDLEFMLDAAPEERRTLLFSATVPPQIVKLAETFQRDAKRISTVSSGDQHADITYQALRVAQSDAENAIINILRYHDAQNAIVFANTRAAVSRLAARFANRGFQTVTLSGELSQSERSHALQAMRDGRARVCVATDVAARGIDLPKLELVVHAELPSNAEGLLHRSGRTGRAGRKGISALIVPPKATKKTERLLRFAKVTAEWTVPPSADDIRAQDEARLLADPVWTAEADDAALAFADTLLAQHDARQIAAACYQMFLAQQSAPEDLSPPDARPEKRERAAFGPSRWFCLSVGRDNGAEPRWLLPLVCRVGGFTKTSIGAIRVQPKESYVEIAEADAAAFLAGLGPDGALDEEVSATAMDKAPDLPAGKPGKPGRPSGPRRPAGPRPPRAEKPAIAKPRWEKSGDGKPAAKREERKDRGPKPKDGGRPPKDGARKEFKRDKGKDAPAKDKGQSKPKFRAGAADTSKPMARPGRSKGKPQSARKDQKGGGKFKGKGGNAAPRRKG